MWRFYGIWMDCLTSMLILTPVILLLIKIQGRKIGSVHTIGVFLYICVLSGIFSVTGIPNMMHWEFDFSYNIIPMVDLFRSTTQYLLNVLMFIPVGFLLPLLWEQYQGWKGVLKFGCFLTMFIVKCLFYFLAKNFKMPIKPLLLFSQKQRTHLALLSLYNSCFLHIHPHLLSRPIRRREGIRFFQCCPVPLWAQI